MMNFDIIQTILNVVKYDDLAFSHGSTVSDAQFRDDTTPRPSELVVG
jgi:hypothetical protein